MSGGSGVDMLKDVFDVLFHSDDLLIDTNNSLFSLNSTGISYFMDFSFDSCELNLKNLGLLWLVHGLSAIFDMSDLFNDDVSLFV